MPIVKDEFIKMRSAKKLLATIGAIVQPLTNKKEITELIKKLHPHKTQFNLIRFGSNGDGGYLVPNDLDGITACFSPGVGQISQFELTCLKHGMKVFMADKSVDRVNLTVPEETYDFQKKFIGCTNNDNFMTMDSWVQSSGLPDSAELMLQMDIEGGEYHALINMSDALFKRFKIMVIEFHSLHYVWDKHFFLTTKTTFEKILQTHVCIHIHPNNSKGIDSRRGVEIPEVAEFTFLRKDRAHIKGYQNQFPHSLDDDNIQENNSIFLPKNWYNGQ